MKKVLITGSNGYIGSHITEKFINEKVKIVCIVRKESNLSHIDTSRVEIRYGDVRDMASLIDASKDCDFVIHNASLVGDWGSYDSFYKVNVEGTINVLNACVRNKIKNVIMTGAVSSYGEENCLKVKNEEYPFNSHYPYFLHSIFPNGNNHYRNTKAEATRQAIKFAGQNNINLTILEPVWVYGEREFNTGFYEYVKSVKDGVFVVPGTKKNKFHVVYVKDLARAYYLAYKKKLEGVNRIIIGNSEVELMNTVFGLFCDETGLKRPYHVPKFAIYPVGFILELIYTIIRSKEPPLLTRNRISMFYDNIEYSTRKAKELLGFSNGYSLQEGIKETVKWYKQNHLL